MDTLSKHLSQAEPIGRRESSRANRSSIPLLQRPVRLSTDVKHSNVSPTLSPTKNHRDRRHRSPQRQVAELLPWAVRHHALLVALPQKIRNELSSIIRPFR